MQIYAGFTSNLVDNLPEINNKDTLIISLTQSINKIAKIDNKISQIDKKEPENKFVDNMRSMIASLTQSVNKISQIDKKNSANW